MHLREKSHLIPFTCAYGPYNLGKIFGTLLRYQNDGVGIALFTTAAKPNPWACRERYHDSWCYAQMVTQLKTEVWGECLVVHSERVEQGKLFVLFLAMIGQSYWQQALKPWIALHQSSLPAALVELSDLTCRPHGQSYLIDSSANAQELVRALKLPCYCRH